MKKKERFSSGILLPARKPQEFRSGGLCARCGTMHYFPGSDEAHREALLLMEELKDRQRIDLHRDEATADPRFSTDYLFGEARGQMFGVMVCRDANGCKQVLRAFSCQYNGEWEVEGWVGPLFNVAAFQELTVDVERRIKELGREIEARETAGTDAQPLKQERRGLSRQLMKEIHALYQLTNFRGETRPIADVFLGTNGIPTGAGDCCAPKLLIHAAKHNLTPLGIAEFYWGEENRSQTREHGRFYPACQDKCAPILGFLLCGLETGINILYRDESILVVEKPAGFLAVPGRGPEMADCVESRVKKILGPDCPNQPAVHRLDMDTSGIMLLAVTAAAHRALSQQFADRQVEKKYIAVVEGIVKEESGTIELPFRLDPDNRPYQVYDPVQGKMGTSHWRRLSVEGNRTRIEFSPLTGRTHQLRLHAAHSNGLGCPIVGDRLYGARKEGNRMLLHATELSFTHPTTGKNMNFSSPAPF